MVNTREVIFNEATAQWYLYIAFFLCSCDKALDCLIRMVQWKHWRTTFSQGTETVLDWKLNIARHCFTNVFQIWTVNSHPAFLLAMWACWQCPLVAMYKYFIWLLAFCHLYYVYIYARMWKKKTVTIRARYFKRPTESFSYCFTLIFCAENPNQLTVRFWGPWRFTTMWVMLRTPATNVGTRSNTSSVRITNIEAASLACLSPPWEGVSGDVYT